MGNNLPQYEPRPTIGYEIGLWISQTVYTRSIPINFLRLLLIWWTAPQIIIFLAGRGNGLICALSVAGLIGSFCLKPKAQKAKTQTGTSWTKDERRLAEAVGQATRAGTPIADAIRSVTDQPLAIDYGTVAGTQRPVLVAPDLRRAHQLITGGSGTGKSKFLATQASQDALTTSVFVIDPHEELVRRFTQSTIPAAGRRGL